MSPTGRPAFQHVIKSGLGPHVVGQRVVVRRILRGQTGPSGGPAMTDLLGVCEAWTASTASVRAEDGTLVEIALADIVSGKPVPPRPSRFVRLRPEEVEHRATALFVPAQTENIGDWILRYTGGANARPNSLLPIGDPGTELDEALARTASFYADRDRTPCAQVVVGSPIQTALEARGWTRLRPEEADTDVLLAGVAAVRRALVDVPSDTVVHAAQVSRAWLSGDNRALAHFDAVAASLALSEASFASISDDGGQIAHGRVNLDQDWAFLADLMVRPDSRRQGHARTLMAGLVDWAAERGASVLLLQVLADNQPAQALYATLGFERHHSYCYLTPPAP